MGVSCNRVKLNKTKHPGATDMAEFEPFSLSEWIVQLREIHNKVIIAVLEPKSRPLRGNGGIF
jgi:hypothetical protein